MKHTSSRMKLLVCLAGLALFLGACLVVFPSLLPAKTASIFPEGVGKPGLSGLPFWLVEDPETGNKLYVLGSVHTASLDLYPLPQAVMDGFSASRTLAVEVDVLALETDVAARNRMLRIVSYSAGETVRNHLPQYLYHRAKEALLRSGRYTVACETYVPAIWSSLLDELTVTQAGLDSRYGIERFFLERAKRENMPVVELESAQAQYQLMADLSDEVGAMLVSQSLQAGASARLTALYGLWQGGDTEAFAQALFAVPEGFSPQDSLTYETYCQFMLTQRNGPMLEKALAFLKSDQTVFYVVGAGHTLGETGIIAGLERAGYSVALQ